MKAAEEIAAALSATPPPLERRDVPHGGRLQAVACTAESVLSPTECERLIAITEAQGYEKALVNVGGGRQMAIDDVRKSGRCMIDAPEAAELLWKRVAPLLPAEKGREPRHYPQSGWRAVGLNERLRFLKYAPGDYFAPHRDGRYARTAKEPGAGEAGDCSSMTLMLYLNAPKLGGETNFLDAEESLVTAVAPKPGLMLAFDHELRHEGALLKAGVKYCVRTDVMYRKVAPDAPPKADPDGPARLAGETESEYASRQARLEEAARERMREKFGGAPLPAAAVTPAGSVFASFAARMRAKFGDAAAAGSA